MNKYFLSALVALFAASTLANFWLIGERDDALTDLAKMRSERDSAQGAAQTCSDSVKGLRLAAEDAARVAAPKIAESKKQETVRQTKAQVILSTPPSKPGDDCGSAKDSAKAWLEGWKE